MKDYKRLTKQDWHNAKFSVITHEDHRSVLYRLWELENRIESGELCDRKETAREILQYMYEKIGNAPLSDIELVKYLAIQYGLGTKNDLAGFVTTDVILRTY